MADTTLTEEVRRKLVLNRDLSSEKAATLFGVSPDQVRRWRAAIAKEGTMTELNPNTDAPVDPAPAEPIPDAEPTPIETAPSAKAKRAAKPSKAQRANAAIKRAAKGKAAAKATKPKAKAAAAKPAAKTTKAKVAKAPRVAGEKRDQYGLARGAVVEAALVIHSAQREDYFKGKTELFRTLLKEVKGDGKDQARTLAGTSDSNVKFQRRLVRRELEQRGAFAAKPEA